MIPAGYLRYSLDISSVDVLSQTNLEMITQKNKKAPKSRLERYVRLKIYLGSCGIFPSHYAAGLRFTPERIFCDWLREHSLRAATFSAHCFGLMGL